MLPFQLGQQRRENVEANRHAAKQPDSPAQRPWLSVIPAIVSFRSWKTRCDSCSSESPAGVIDAAADAEKDGLLQLFFEQQDLPADRRLRDVQLVAGRGERAGLRDGANDLEPDEGP